MNKNLKLILEMLIGLSLALGLIYWATTRPTEADMRREYMKKGFSKEQIDSIIEKRNNDLGAYMLLAS